MFRNRVLTRVFGAKREMKYHEAVGNVITEAQNILGCTAVFLIGCRPPIKNTAVHPRRF
jgi:hypothetical protein